jgi:hypothetical protein
MLPPACQRAGSVTCPCGEARRGAKLMASTFVRA